MLADGVEVNAPVPLVPAQVCVDSLGMRVTVEALSAVSMLPNWSSIATVGLVEKSVSTVAEVEGCTVKATWLLTPGTSVKVPKLVELVMLLMTDVPLLVILPVASGVPADGRTRIPDQVIMLRHPPDETRVMLIVIVVCVGVTVCEAAAFISRGLAPVQFPAELVLVAVTLLVVVLKINPDGAFKIIVPVPISALAPSVMAGPVSVVNVPPVVSAEMAEPPVAGVAVAAANAVDASEKTTAITAMIGIDILEDKRGADIGY